MYKASSSVWVVICIQIIAANNNNNSPKEKRRALLRNNHYSFQCASRSIYHFSLDRPFLLSRFHLLCFALVYSNMHYAIHLAKTNEWNTKTNSMICQNWKTRTNWRSKPGWIEFEFEFESEFGFRGTIERATFGLTFEAGSEVSSCCATAEVEPV